MKQLILIFATLLFAMENSFAQDSLQIHNQISAEEYHKYSSPAKFSKEYYLLKSAKINRAAWVFLSVGTVMTVTGIIVYEKYHNSENTLENVLAYPVAAEGEALAVVGSAFMITSIPLFIISGNYRKKTLNMSATLNMAHLPTIAQSGISMKQFPSVGLRIQF